MAEPYGAAGLSADGHSFLKRRGTNVWAGPGRAGRGRAGPGQGFPRTGVARGQSLIASRIKTGTGLRAAMKVVSVEAVVTGDTPLRPSLGPHLDLTTLSQVSI